MEFKTDRYNNCAIYKFREDTSELEQDLKKIYTNKEYNSVWIKLIGDQLNLLPFLRKQGFTLHNAQSDKAVMYKWLKPDKPNRIPAWTPATISIIAAVVHNGKVLVVNEKSKKKNGYKFVTGYVDEGETMEEAVIREVKEETGLDVVVKGLIGVRHLNRFKYGNHDISFAFLATPKTDNVDTVPDMEEIEKVSWITIEEFKQHPPVFALHDKLIECLESIPLQKLGTGVSSFTDRFHYPCNGTPVLYGAI